ncbi:PREDICTED: MORC family CW-type zinc finger protein 3-like [Ipomoea nil]|uniref:MORC family CW-type zinc finger protein 3-like n=1 Tax=Ipomoea nil TaxID=35883 RepID=UPI0009013539|nr:PREDICTED: MORC family CW-type zinc finger protein 3-like [Ipomoea nil]
MGHIDFKEEPSHEVNSNIADFVIVHIDFKEEPSHEDFVMGHAGFKEEPSNEDGSGQYVMLMKDKKIICRTRCNNLPGKIPGVWSILRFARQSSLEFLSGSSHFLLECDPENAGQRCEWRRFMNFLQKNERVAICKLGTYDLFIVAPLQDTNFKHAAVMYQRVENPAFHGSNMHDAVARIPPMSREQAVSAHKPINTQQPSGEPGKSHGQSRHNSSAEAAVSNSAVVEDLKVRSNRSPEEAESNGSLVRNYVRTDPSYLKTLGHTHSGWIFGAIAELVDNSRDAKATKLEISIDLIYLKSVGEEIPMLSVIDDGCGMTHQEILQMISFGHRQPEEDDRNRIGRFGIGFKTGAMRLGKDALVFTQTTNSRSIAFLSQSLNEGKDNLEIPIISYRKIGQLMELDISVQDEVSAKCNLKTIKNFSPFDKYFIGEKSGLFSDKGTGTQIYIWNLDKWGSDYSLQWDPGMSGGSSFHQGDILVRSKRIRTRPGQMTQMVPLDYSLRSYLEVIFFNPRMKMYVQGAQVKSCSLARSLNNTVVEKDTILEKPVRLILGRNQIEWERANCGIFLYWHGRLIEAYKRVGSMIHNGDKGRGIIGVIEVMDLMDDGCGRVSVHNNKQGFLDCEVYAELERWLGERVDSYIDDYVDKVELRKGSRFYKPDHDWVQCYKCRKWRMLPSAFDIRALPIEWFCYMKPYNGNCEMAEQMVEHGVITISSKRTEFESREDPLNVPHGLSRKGTNASKDASKNRKHDSPDLALDNYDEQLEAVSFKRLRRGPARSCRKS